MLWHEDRRFVRTKKKTNHKIQNTKHKTPEIHTDTCISCAIYHSYTHSPMLMSFGVRWYSGAGDRFGVCQPHQYEGGEWSETSAVTVMHVAFPQLDVLALVASAISI